MLKSLIGFCKKIIYILWFLFLLAVGMWVAMDNAELITITLFGFQFMELTVGVYMGVILTIGVVLGFCTSYFYTRARMLSTKRELSKVNKEVESLRITQNRV